MLSGKKAYICSPLSAPDAGSLPLQDVCFPRISAIDVR